MTDEVIDTLHMIFLILYFVSEHFNLDSQVFLLLLVILRQHLKASLGRFFVDHILLTKRAHETGRIYEADSVCLYQKETNAAKKGTA